MATAILLRTMNERGSNDWFIRNESLFLNSIHMHMKFIFPAVYCLLANMNVCIQCIHTYAHTHTYVLHTHMYYNKLTLAPHTSMFLWRHIVIQKLWQRCASPNMTARARNRRKMTWAVSFSLCWLSVIDVWHWYYIQHFQNSPTRNTSTHLLLFSKAECTDPALSKCLRSMTSFPPKPISTRNYVTIELVQNKFLKGDAIFSKQ